ncbi:unnamed protein product [Polarella glacialis]|uniref:Uncharacterized protein n=1 Tax=Polarella glacialis TaxID=89957 RepID=A0A813FU12_POLGL|nr:unnamed protein product [Polarella glacialis]
MQCQPGNSQAKTAIHDSSQRPHTPSAGKASVRGACAHNQCASAAAAMRRPGAAALSAKLTLADPAGFVVMAAIAAGESAAAAAAVVVVVVAATVVVAAAAVQERSEPISIRNRQSPFFLATRVPPAVVWKCLASGARAHHHTASSWRAGTGGVTRNGARGPSFNNRAERPIASGCWLALRGVGPTPHGTCDLGLHEEAWQELHEHGTGNYKSQ